jgi:peptidoglycan glycosyltransferase
MDSISKRSKILYTLVMLFVAGVGILTVRLISNAETWAMKQVNQHIYSAGQLIAAGTITDRKGVVLAQTVNGKRSFNPNAGIRKATFHTVGDLSGFVATGAHSVFKSDLTGYSLINGVYNLRKDGAGKDIRLTIDSALCATVLKELENKKGTIGVYNYETGEILCMVSTPTLDINNKPSDIDSNNTKKYEGIYMNRFLSGVFTPGSTFKVVTAACAIDNISDIYSRTFYCNGSFKTSTGVVKCNGVHGTVSFEQAINKSCNSAFAAIAQELGNDALTQTAEKMGFNKRIVVNGINVTKSYFTLQGAVSVDRGWAGIGQYKTLVNPLHMITIMGAIASNGSAPAPRIVSQETSLFSLGSSQTLRYLSVTTANKLKALLRSNVENYYGDSKFPGLEMCGKTGTAEVKNKRPHAWFVGFSQNKDKPYAIVVIIENGGTGIGDALPVANRVMQAVVK